MIEISDLSFAYPNSNFTVKVDALSLATGETLAIVGPSGSGKTTLLNLMAGLLKPQQGQISLGDTKLLALGDAKLRAFRLQTLGFVFQDFRLVEYLSGMDNIIQPYRLSSSMHLNAQVRERAKSLAKQAGVLEKLSRRPAGLSQGEKQRVAICRALITQPKIILADEATGNLDPENKLLILDLLFDQARQSGASLVAVTHDHALLDRFDRVVDFADFRISEAV